MLRHDWIVEDLLDLPDDGNRYEVLDGELLVTPAPSFAHQRVALAFRDVLHRYLVGGRFGEALVAPADVEFSPRRLVQPDVFVIPFSPSGSRASKFVDVGRLLMAIEVLSPTTARVDRVKKRQVYREQGVPEYWIVDLDARTVERSTPADDRIEICADRIDWHPAGASAPLAIELGELFRAALD